MSKASKRAQKFYDNADATWRSSGKVKRRWLAFFGGLAVGFLIGAILF